MVNKLQETSDLEKSSNSHRDFGAVWKVEWFAEEAKRVYGVTVTATLVRCGKRRRRRSPGRKPAGNSHRAFGAVWKEGKRD